MPLRNVAGTIKGMQAEGKGATDLEPRDDFVEDVVARGPTMFMDVGEEVIDRGEALMATVDAALEAGLPPDAETRSRDLLLEPRFDGFRISLSEDPPTRLEPFHVKLKMDADLSKVKAKPRVYPPAKTAWLNNKFAHHRRRNGVRDPASDMFKPCQAIPKGNGYRLVGDFKAVNQQSAGGSEPKVTGNCRWLRTRKNYSRL